MTFFHIFSAFLTLWNADRRTPACSLWDFISPLWSFAVEQNSADKGTSVKYCQWLLTLSPISEVFGVNRIKGSVRRALAQLLRCVAWALSVSGWISNSNLCHRNSKSVSIIKFSGYFFLLLAAAERPVEAILLHLMHQALSSVDAR